MTLLFSPPNAGEYRVSSRITKDTAEKRSFLRILCGGGVSRALLSLFCPSRWILFSSDTFLSLDSTWIPAKISFLGPFCRRVRGGERREERVEDKTTTTTTAAATQTRARVRLVPSVGMSGARGGQQVHLPDLPPPPRAVGWCFLFFFFSPPSFFILNECSQSRWGGGGSRGFEPAHSCVASADSHGYRWRARPGLSECKLTM